MTMLRINGESRDVEAPDDMPLLWVLRDVLGMTGTKFGCGIAQCGACTVHLDGKPVRSCLLAVGTIGNRAVTTIEGIGATGPARRVQKAWLDLEVIQCGYCQSGQIMSAAALLAGNPKPDRRRHRCGHGGQYLPLRHLRAHSRRRSSAAAERGLGGERWRQRAIVACAKLFAPRLLPGGCAGGLVLGFRLPVRAANEPEQAPDNTAASSRPTLSSVSTVRQDDARDAAGRDGAGHLYRCRHDPRRRARCRLLAGRARARAAQTTSSTAIRSSAFRPPATPIPSAHSGCRCALRARRRARCWSQAAAAQWQVDPASCTAANGKVTHAASGRAARLRRSGRCGERACRCRKIRR